MKNINLYSTKEIKSYEIRESDNNIMYVDIRVRCPIKDIHAHVIKEDGNKESIKVEVLVFPFSNRLCYSEDKCRLKLSNYEITEEDKLVIEFEPAFDKLVATDVIGWEGKVGVTWCPYADGPPKPRLVFKDFEQAMDFVVSEEILKTKYYEKVYFLRHED